MELVGVGEDEGGGEEAVIAEMGIEEMALQDVTTSQKT